MSLITLNFDKNFSYVIIYWILEIIFRIIFSLREQYFNIVENIVHNEYIYVLLLNIADIISGFLVIYTKCASKGVREMTENKNRSKSGTKLIYDDSQTKLKKSFYIKLLFIAILDYLSRSSYWISYSITKAKPENISNTFQRNITISIDIIMRYIFSIYILKIVVFKHRIVSMITIGIGFAILIINDILLMVFNETRIGNTNNYDIDKTFFYTAIASISGFAYPLEDTFVKQIFSEDYIYPANLQLAQGTFELILLLIITPILYYSFKIKLVLISDNLTIVIITMVIYTLAAFVKAFILLKIIYHYSSQSVSFLIISQSFGGSIMRVIYLSRGNSYVWKYFSFILEVIGIVMILFASLIYDEIVIINKWQLNENVKPGIINRGELEMQNMNIISEAQNNNSQPFLDDDNNERNSGDNNDENNNNEKDDDENNE